MAKRKNFYYILVLTDEGPVFVTKTNFAERTSFWNRDEAPKLMSKDDAENISWGLNVNGHQCYMICSRWEITSQPYRYDKGTFEWVWKEKENDDEQ